MGMGGNSFLVTEYLKDTIEKAGYELVVIPNGITPLLNGILIHGHSLCVSVMWFYALKGGCSSS